MAAPKWTPEERKRARERLAALEVNGPLDFGAARRAIEKDDAVDEARGALVAGKSLEEILASKTPEQIAAIERVVKAGIAAQLDDEEGFGAFYEVVHKRRMPAHCKEWVKKIYEAHREGKGIVIEAFRGSTKTTAVTITFVAWRIGKEPEKNHLIVQVGDDIAQDNIKQIADIIENNEGWRLVFPNIVPDRERGWGASGYEIKRIDMDYTEWREANSIRKDPTLVGFGYKSSALIGKHPTGCLVIDDIHDEKNTGSRRELENVHVILKGTIYPAPVTGTWEIFIGTPWVEQDTLRYTLATGEYEHCFTPVMEYRDDGDMEYKGRRAKLYWGDEFGIKEIEREERKVGAVQFARMFMLDLTAAANRVMKYMSYPASEIRYNWVMAGGVDYASHRDAARNAEGKLDYFAMCYLAKLPGGGAVVVDGVLEHGTQAQGEVFVKRAQEIFPLWRHSAVEAVGKGDDFVQVILRNPGLRILPMTTGGKSKANRFEVQMSPWLESGAVRISDAETPFLQELRRELDNYPLLDHDDALDALYYACKAMPEVLVVAEDKDEVEEKRKKRELNPFAALGRA